MILEGLSTAQYHGQAGGILSQGRSGVKPSKLKVGADTRLGDSMLPPENSMPSLEDDGDKTLDIQKQENRMVAGPTSTHNKLLAAGDGSAAFEDAGKKIPNQSGERHTGV